MKVSGGTEIITQIEFYFVNCKVTFTGHQWPLQQK